MESPCNSGADVPLSGSECDGGKGDIESVRVLVTFLNREVRAPQRRASGVHFIQEGNDILEGTPHSI